MNLFDFKDENYREFNSRLIPNIDKNTIIGIRMPILRKLANEIIKNGNAKDFIKILPHKYYEENVIHGLIIEKIKNENELFFELERFLLYIDNWAVCDFIAPTIFKKSKTELYKHIENWLNSDHTYTIRFAIGMLNRYFLDKDFKLSHANRVAQLKSDEYYVNMMRAWYFATALAKQYDSVIHIFENKILDKWTHNKAIQKAKESFRVTKEHKEYLNNLKYKRS